MAVDGPITWEARVWEDGSFSVLARVCALQGTGTQVEPREGPCLKQADVSSITCKVYSLGTSKDATTGAEVTPAPTLTAAANIFDTLRTAGWDTDRDQAGYNFRHDLSPAYTALPGTADVGEWYEAEYKITLTDGGVLWIKFKYKTIPVITS